MHERWSLGIVYINHREPADIEIGHVGLTGLDEFQTPQHHYPGHSDLPTGYLYDAEVHLK